MIQKHDNGTFSKVLSTTVYRCLDCGTVLKPRRVVGIGQQKSIERSLASRINEEKTADPDTTTIDLREITGAKKKLLRVPGGLSGM